MGLLQSKTIDKALKKSILKILESNIKGDILSKQYQRKFYSVDSSAYQIIPEIIIIPKNEEDIIKTIKIANIDYLFGPEHKYISNSKGQI